MHRELPGARWPFGGIPGRRHDDGAARKCRFQIRAGDRSRAKESRWITGDVQDRGFEADVGRSTVDDHVDQAVQVAEDVLGPGGREPVRSVRARRRERFTGLLDQSAGHVRCRYPQADRRLARGHDVRDSLGSVQDDRQRSGPESRGENLRRVRPLGRAPPGLLDIGHVDDERIDGGSSLGRIDPRHGFLVRGDSPESVDGLGRESDEPSASQHPGRLVNRRGIGIVRIDHQDGCG